LIETADLTRKFALGNTGIIIAGILLVIDLLLLYVARATFRREEILTKWK
jgi:hypothetical protein